MVDAYDVLADVYEWLVPPPLLTPTGAAAAFAGVTDMLDAGARVLDCAAGTGQLAVGLALAGFEVVASDGSAAMVRRTRELAGRHGVAIAAAHCEWADLATQDWHGSFDAVFCVGNSLTHAVGPAGRRTALHAMAQVLRDDGLLVLTSRNWERVREQGSGLQVGEHLVERDGQRALVVHGWTIAPAWDDRHTLDVAVARIDDAGGVTTSAEKLSFWPFRRDDLAADLRAAGLEPATSTYRDQDERYLVTARARPRHDDRHSGE